MLFREVINLIGVTAAENAMGDIVETETSRQVCADKKSIRQSEFYQAAATGLRPELMFIVRSIDYEQEPKLEYNNKKYTIIRVYDKDDEFAELICEGVVNNAGT